MTVQQYCTVVNLLIINIHLHACSIYNTCINYNFHQWVIPENIHTIQLYHGQYLGIPREWGVSWTEILKARGGRAVWNSKCIGVFSSEFPEKMVKAWNRWSDDVNSQAWTDHGQAGWRFIRQVLAIMQMSDLRELKIMFMLPLLGYAYFLESLTDNLMNLLKLLLWS